MAQFCVKGHRFCKKNRRRIKVASTNMGRMEIPETTQVYLPQRHLDAPVAPVARGPWIQADAHQRPPLVGRQPFPLQAFFVVVCTELERSILVTGVCNDRLKLDHCFFGTKIIFFCF